MLSFINRKMRGKKSAWACIVVVDDDDDEDVLYRLCGRYLANESKREAMPWHSYRVLGVKLGSLTDGWMGEVRLEVSILYEFALGC